MAFLPKTKEHLFERKPHDVSKTFTWNDLLEQIIGDKLNKNFLRHFATF